MKVDDLIRRLAPLAKHDTRNIAQGDRFSFVSAFVARRTETFQSIALPGATGGETGRYFLRRPTPPRRPAWRRRPS
jgi:hypothetical protein